MFAVLTVRLTEALAVCTYIVLLPIRGRLVDGTFMEIVLMAC